MRDKGKNKKGGDDSGGGDWALSYGDMMTLLCTFFILIVSFSTTELVKFRKAMGSLRGSMGVLLEQDGASILYKTNQGIGNKSNTSVGLETLQEIEKLIFELNIEDAVDIEMINEGVKFRIGDNILFPPGSAELNPQSQTLLEAIGMLVFFFSHDVRVEGHSDSSPVSYGTFTSNWELSASRALSVIRYFVEELGIDPTRLVAAGCGEYKPLLPNTTLENRARNRRVEIYLNWKRAIPL